MPRFRVAVICGAALLCAVCCAPGMGQTSNRSSSLAQAPDHHPFALPDSLSRVKLPATEALAEIPSGKPNTLVPAPRVNRVSGATPKTPVTAAGNARPRKLSAVRVLTPTAKIVTSEAVLPPKLVTPKRSLVHQQAHDLELAAPVQVQPPDHGTGGRFSPTAVPTAVAPGVSVRPSSKPRRVERPTARPTLTVPPLRDPRLLEVKRLPPKLLEAGPLGSARLLSPDGKIRLVAEEESVLVPLAVEPPDQNVNLEGEHGLVTLIATGAELKSVLRMIADHHGMNLVLGPEVAGPVTVSIRGARLEEVLDAILGVAGFAWHRVGNLLYVTGANAAGMDPRVQGRTLRVYPLDYVSAADIEAVANGLLSPVGNAYISESDSADELKTREILVVEDTSAAHQRIAQYIAQIDIPPKQVLVEAHVLQIALRDEEKHGIDFRTLFRVDNSKITLEGSGFTDLPTDEAVVTFRIDGTDLDSVVELIRRNTNSRTLASPKLSVVNHQEARIQIGQRLPYSVATTTQTTTVQSVEFLEVGIVLTVRPVITADGNVLMNVLPKVSGGKITDNGFPEEETTEVQTTIMIPDGGGVIIGGLIREENIENRAFIPYFSRVPLMGHLFKKRRTDIRRNELVVALVTHVISDGYGPRMKEVMDLECTLPEYASSELIREAAPVVHYK